MDRHIESCNERFEHIDIRAEKLIAAQERCTLALEKLAEDTSGLVSIYDQAQTAVKITTGVQRFGLWLIKWPLIGGGLFAAYRFFADQIIKLGS